MKKRFLIETMVAVMLMTTVTGTIVENTNTVLAAR